MSSFLCFVCHSTVNEDTNEETREKYREVIGMNLCPDSHLCYICCYFLNKMCMFKSICLKRTLEYPVLFSEKGTINLQRSLTTVSILCPEDICLQHLNTHYHFYNNNENSQSDFDESNYCELQDDRNFDLSDTLLKTGPIENFHNEDYLFVTKDSVVDNLFNEELMIPNIEPVRITQNDLVNGKWMENVYKNDRYKQNTLLELNSRNEVSFERMICPVISESNQEHLPVSDYNIQGNMKQISLQDNQCALSDRTMDLFHEKNECHLQNYPNMHVPLHNMSFNTQNPYDHIQNHENQNIPSSIFDNRQSCNVRIENVNESVTKINESVKNVNECMINRNQSITNTAQSETSISEQLITINELNESVSKTNDLVSNPNEINNSNQYVSETNVSENHTNTTKIETNECVSNINESVNDLNESDNSPYESESNINESDTELTENQNSDTKIYGSDTELNENEHDTKVYVNSKSSDVENSPENHDSSIEDTEQKQPSKQYLIFTFKDLYEKISLSSEEQKAELDRARKDDKYVTAAFKCHNCAMYFHFKDTYQAHMMRHEESNGEHSCSICSLRFANPAVLRSHLANHRERYQCNACHARVRARQRASHARACVGDADSVTCHLCGNVFPCNEYFQQHLQRVHGTDSNKSYLCNVCGKSFNTRARVRTHMITHLNRKFNCAQCPAVFSSPYTLRQHNKSKHVTSAPQVHPCDTCHVTYNTRKSLLAHVRHAHKDTVYKCDACGRCCPSEAALSQHTASVHERTNHLACRFCPKRYSTTKSLVKHVSTYHKEGKPDPLCHSCGVTFKTTTILKKHLKNVCEKDRKQTSLEDELLRVSYFE